MQMALHKKLIPYNFADISAIP